MKRRAVATVITVVPVHDEEDSLDACLRALMEATRVAEQRGIRCITRVVLDACHDNSSAIAEGYPFPVVRVNANLVGAARSAGVEDARRELGPVRSRSVWIATTDGDSEVPPEWITHQCDLARRGADVFLGTVRPRFADLSEPHRQHWLRTHPRGAPNGHVHGASLGVRLRTYDAVGGFGPVAEHEDVELVERCRRLGAVMVPSDFAEVLTSGRFVGRTPRGYAGYLRDQALELDAAAMAADPLSPTITQPTDQGLHRPVRQRVEVAPRRPALE